MKIVNIKTPSKLHLTGFLSEPESKDKNSIIVHIHGMAGDPYTNKWYPHFHKLYPKEGIAFLVGNHRGTGSITTFFQEPDKYPNYGNSLEIFEDCIPDIEAWVNYAKKLGYRNIHIQSHSFAPSKVVYYMSKKKESSIKTLIFISPVDMLGLTLADKKAHDKMLSEAKQLIKEGKGNQLLSKLLDGESYLSANTYLNLFSKNSKGNIFCYTSRRHDWAEVNKIDRPVLIIGGTKDMPMEAVSSTKKALSILKRQLIKSPKVVTKVYPGAEHGFEGYERRIVKDVSDFIFRKS